jgi:hypothetical protein
MSKRRKKKKPVIDKKFGVEGAYVLLWAKRIPYTRIILIIVVLLFIWRVSVVSFENRDIKKNGRVIIGVIDDTRKVGGKGIRRCTYRFSTHNGKYGGWVDDDYLNVGDSIEIMYLPNDPFKNRAVKFFKR